MFSARRLDVSHSPFLFFHTLIAVRYSAIERENMKLLRKMQSILMHTNPAFAENRPAGPRSLNIGARRAEMNRITADNLVSVY
jgi:hypothetical protein